MAQPRLTGEREMVTPVARGEEYFINQLKSANPCLSEDEIKTLATERYDKCLANYDLAKAKIVEVLAGYGYLRSKSFTIKTVETGNPITIRDGEGKVIGTNNSDIFKPDEKTAAFKKQINVPQDQLIHSLTVALIYDRQAQQIVEGATIGDLVENADGGVRIRVSRAGLTFSK